MPKIAGDEIYTYYGTIWRLYINEVEIITACVFDVFLSQLISYRTFFRKLFVRLGLNL